VSDFPKGRFFCGKEVVFMRVSIECCEGRGGLSCAKVLCPVYSSAERRIKPVYIGTGFGNLNGDSSEASVLAEVRREIAAHTKYDINHGTGNPI
jgi:hypothetical protein